MKKQKGAALIVVLSLLVISLMIGLSSIQSSMIDERLAGNYKAEVEAQMGAEKAVSEGVSEFLSSSVSDDVFSDDDPLNMTWEDFVDLSSLSAGCTGYVSCHYYYYRDDEDALYVVGLGIVSSGNGRVLATSEMIFAEVEYASSSDSGLAPFSDGLIGCEGVAVSGGGRVESRIRTFSENSDIRLTGGTDVVGDVIATGGVFTDGSGSVGGDIRANGDVVINASAEYGGSVFSKGNVIFNNTARFSGGVDADGDVQFNNGAKLAGDLIVGGDVDFDHTGAYVEGGVTAAGDINNNFDSWKETSSFSGGGIANGPHAGVASVKGGNCDSISLLSRFEKFEMPSNGDIVVGNWPKVNATITPDKITSYDQTWNVQEDVVLAESASAPVLGFEEEVPVIRTGDMTLTNGEMRVSGGDVVLYVDGDLTLGSGGGPGLNIDPGSTLTIFVTGSTKIKSSTQMSDVDQVTNGRPTFSLFSSKEDVTASQSSITIDGSSKATANIYAPFANVRVAAGGGLNGSVRAKTVEVSGGAGVFYDQELSDWGVGEGEEEEDGSQGRILSWR